MSAAAWDLIQKCFSTQTNDRGGIATGLGKSTYPRIINKSISILILVGEKDRLYLVVQEYKPSVQCGVPSFSATGGVREACQAALNTLPVSTFSQTFGAKGAPGAEIELPKSYSDGERNFYGHNPASIVVHLLNETTDNSRCFVTVDITGPPVASN